MTQKPSVAVIGLGQMGSAMALRLNESEFDVIGWDIDPAVREQLAFQGVPVGASLADALKGRLCILSSLPNGLLVKECWLGRGGLVELADQGTTLIDLSTIEPSVMRRAAAHAYERGLKVLDCPVSGGPVEARAGKLVLIVGGEAGVIEQTLPLLNALGSTIRHTGDVGTAKVVKIINNTMAMGNLAVACEAFALGEACGVDTAVLFDVLSESGGRSMTFTKRFPPALKGDFEARFKLSLAEKDLGLGLAMAQDMGIPAPAATLVRGIFSQALAEGYGGKDAVALLAISRDRIRKALRK
ncbi:NAD(P)-dependent oxidoreductase [Allopusillimonas ginsengisoli]|uniref:NAD(P)-dependent oxidoreductase n=1 Tax=Allopusillimonas ginsengisoli TaxID=453575 RepID=UPI00101F53BA|nr:NAD(P)-dependent oxidoreductase [Allopusillimonas ginsengisoli]TEA79596.1 NAD(P)-dependent oxidoreductase [Allopusillimonas ginsengisoli]